MTSLAKFVNNLESNPNWEKYPIVHTTLINCMKSILKNKSLSCIQCNVFNEKLLYFFYGKPSYKNKSSDPSLYPVCFILKNSIVQSNEIKYVFPFDSGAFNANKYEDFIDKNKKLNAYALPKNIQAIGKFLNYFFDDFTDYYCGNPKNLEIPDFPFELKECYKLYNASGIQKFDERAKSIEIILKKDIQLISQNIELLICPESLRQNIDKCFMGELDFKVKYYKTNNLDHPLKYYGILEYVADEYINKLR